MAVARFVHTRKREDICSSEGSLCECNVQQTHRECVCAWGHFFGSLRSGLITLMRIEHEVKTRAVSNCWIVSIVSGSALESKYVRGTHQDAGLVLRDTYHPI